MAEVIDKTPDRRRLLLLALVLLGVVTRFFRLDFQSLFIDEGYVLSIANAVSLSEAWHAAVGDASHPPLYYLMGFVWCQCLGPSIWSIRALSAFFGTFNIFLCQRSDDMSHPSDRSI